MATNASVGRNVFDRVITDRGLGIAAALMLAIVSVAVARGHADWSRISAPVWTHLALIAAALGLTPVMLLRPKGTRSHRVLG
jgi:hypothetical protein